MSDTPFSRGSRAAPPVLTLGDPVPLADRVDNRVLIPPVEGPPPRPPGDHIQALDGRTMGTTWSVRAIGPRGLTEAALREAIERELATVVALFSPWEPSSEISRFNAAPPGMWAVSQPFWDQVEAALKVSGWGRLRMNREARGLMQPGGMKLDLSGIAKGHAVDRVSDALAALGATSHLVEIGGELKGRGVKPDAQPWWVEIERAEGDASPRTVAALFDLAMATSGDYRRAFRHEGRLYPHTIDGSTGRPVSNNLASVTVLHASAMKADAYASALTVMGPFEGPEYAEAVGLAALFVERTPRGLVERMSPAFKAMMEDGAEAAPG